MDPDPGGTYTTSAFFKTTVLTVAFSSIYFYKTGNQHILFKPAQIQVTDTVAVTVVIKEKLPVKKKKKNIYMTFDDGPNKGTRNVKRIIEEEQVPATLFVIGQHVFGTKWQTTLFDSLDANSLFEIANHSYTHAFQNKYAAFYELPDSVVKDFKRCADSLHLTSNIIRTPGRNVWRTDSLCKTDLKSTIVAADSLYKKGYRAMGWDLEWHFNSEQRLVQTTDEMLDEIYCAFENNGTQMNGELVLLAHDQVFANTDDSSSLHQFIIQLKKRDEYNFEAVSKYPGVIKP